MARKLIAALTDSTVFLREWLANPQRMGSVAPSSPQLAAVMAGWLPANPESFVLELGPGTGAVTQALLERGLREEKLVAIEHNSNMSRLLREKFPRAQIITGDAWRMDDLLRRRREPIENVGAVVSSLPLLNFPLAAVESLAKKNPRRARTAGNVGAIQLSNRQIASAGIIGFPSARFQNCLVQPAARARQRFSEVILTDAVVFPWWPRASTLELF